MIGRALQDAIWQFISEDGADLPWNMRPAAVALSTGKTVRDAVVGAFNPVDGRTVKPKS